MKEYKKQMHKDFKKIAHKVPFNKPAIKMAALMQPVLYEITPVPKEIIHETCKTAGYEEAEISVDIFSPEGAEGKLPALLYLHGGGFGYRAAPHHKKLACIYAKIANCRVIMPNYHLLPKYKFPAAYTDVHHVYEWMIDRADELKIDIHRIAVGGDSAGAVLAANLCNFAEVENMVIPCFQMLIYPVTDVEMQTESMKRYMDTPLWNAVNNRRMWNMYLENATWEEMAQASPAYNELPLQIPDTYIETAEIDCLHDEGIAYAKKLKEAGARVKIHETKGTIHGYDSAIKCSVTKENIKLRLYALRAAFRRGNM